MANKSTNIKGKIIEALSRNAFMVEVGGGKKRICTEHRTCPEGFYKGLKVGASVTVKTSAVDDNRGWIIGS